VSSKRKSRHKKQLPMQQVSKPDGSTINPATGLRNDEVAFGIDPKEPGKVKNYVLPDGRVLTPEELGISDGIPSIIHPDLIVAQKGDKSTRSTLASRLGEMLIVAENLFGRRDRQYTFLGFEFTSDNPNIQFGNNKSMIMQLHLGALFEPMSAYAEMAHECIHILSPNPKKPSTILEEGIAEVFAYIYMRDTMKYEIKTKEPGTAYHEAAQLVALLMSFNPYGIKEMREEEPTISLISKSLIWKHYPMLEEGVAARLARTFVRDNCDDPRILGWYESESGGISNPNGKREQTEE
jgi:hypothetical protein